MKEARVRHQINEYGKETYVLEKKIDDDWVYDETFYLREIDGNNDFIDCWILAAMMHLQHQGYTISISY